MTQASKPALLRETLASGQFVVAPGVYAMLSAKMVLASSMAPAWVLDTCSRTSRAGASQRSDAVKWFSFGLWQATVGAAAAV